MEEVGMPIVGLNRNLLASMKSDLKVITEITDEVGSWCDGSPGPFTRNHWHASRRSNTTKEDRSLEEEYVKLLEELYESQSGLVYSITEYMNKMPIVAKQLASPAASTGGYFQDKPSTGTLCRMLWTRLQLIQKWSIMPQPDYRNTRDETSSISARSKTEENGVKCEAATQTMIVSLNGCESCDVSVACVRRIVGTIQTSQRKSRVAKLRRKMREDLLTISQVGAMDKWTAAVCSDLYKMIGRLQSISLTNEKLNDRLDSMAFHEREQSERMEELKGRLTSLDNHVSITNTRLEIEEAKATRYAKRIKELEDKLKRYERPLTADECQSTE